MQIEFPPLEEWQKALFRLYRDNPKGKWIVTKSKRQVGKSICLELLLLYVSLSNKNAYSLLVSPVISQSRKIYKEIEKMSRGLTLKCNASLLSIEYKNGATIEFASAEQGDSIRGRTIKKGGILCVDEASYISDEFFYDVLLPTTNVSDADIIITSTPKYKQGFFYELFSKGQAGLNPKVISIDWNDYNTSKFLSNETLELYRQQLPARTFMSEYMAQFIDGTSMIFGELEGCIVKGLKLAHKNQVVLGVDWGSGTGGDNTVVSAGQVVDGKIVIPKQLAFNDKGANETVDFILEEVKKYVNKGFRDIDIIVEKNSIGQVYYSLLFDRLDEWETMYNDSVSWNKEVEVNLHLFTTTNNSKKRIIEQLTNLFEKRRIQISDDPALKSELGTYECKVDKNGTVTYNATTGFHDDRVMSMAFVTDYLYKEVF